MCVCVGVSAPGVVVIKITCRVPPHQRNKTKSNTPPQGETFYNNVYNMIVYNIIILCHTTHITSRHVIKSNYNAYIY